MKYTHKTTVQARYFNKGDVVTVPNTNRSLLNILFGTRRYNYFEILNDDYESKSGWNIVFNARDLNLPHKPAIKFNTDMMESYLVKRMIN